ncbi:TPA: PDZ domain-containing protein, partial [Streptococcus pyogenes]|nr:PDZ domain-containing protein [Streptococcus pyogenes]
MKRLKKIKWWLVGLLALISLLLALFFPLPYYIEMPGGAYDIRTVLQVNGKEDKRKGAYQFVAVGISRASLAQLLYAWLTPFTEISTAEDTTGGYSDADFLRINQFYMETSQNAAIYQALSLAGKPVTLDYKGVYVLDVNNESTFKGTLHLADTVTGVNGKQFTSSAELIDYVSHLKLGDEVTIQFTSDNKPKKGVGRIIKLKNGKNGIGIALTDHTSVNSEDTVIFSTKGVGGPSAGLMFTLDIYDQIT